MLVMKERVGCLRAAMSSHGGKSETADKMEEFRLSAKKVELPTFDGKDLVAWIARAETYFEVHRTSEDV